MTRDTTSAKDSSEPRTVSYSPSREGRPADGDALPAVGEVIDGTYRVEQVVGAGGMGVVVCARHLELGERVAVKLLRSPAEPGALVRFRREARIALRMKSEHVTRLMEVGKLPSGQPYLVMEYLEGESAAQLLARCGPLAVGEAVDIVLGAAAGLAEAHRIGVVHRDLKPSNLFLTRRPDGSRLVKLLDFGIAKLRDDGRDEAGGALTAATVILGSPSYMAPEQIRSARDVDRRADIWSLGVVLYELLCKRLPFEAESSSGIMASIVADPPVPLGSRREGIPSELRRVIERCLEKDRERRFRDVGALARALAPWAAEAGDVERVARTLTSTRAHSAPEDRTTASSWLVPTARSIAPTKSRWLGVSVALLLGTAGIALAEPRPALKAEAVGRWVAAPRIVVAQPTPQPPRVAPPSAPPPPAPPARAVEPRRAVPRPAPTPAVLDVEAATATRK